MIDVGLTRDRILRKTEKRYGMSFVYMVQNQDSLLKIPEKLESIADDFIWNSPCSYHMTLLRCRSKLNDFSILGTENFREIFSTKKAFSIHGKCFELGKDGIIRFKFGNIPPNYWKDDDIRFFESLTGLRYSAIYQPWITLGYVRIEKIFKVEENFDRINKILESAFSIMVLPVDRISLVKYWDTSFNNIRIIETFELR